jgi:hypothetical protein
VPDAKIGRTFSQLVRADPSDKAALAGLVTAYSRFDLEKAELYAQQLPAVDGVSRADWNSPRALPGPEVPAHLIPSGTRTFYRTRGPTSDRNDQSFRDTLYQHVLSPSGISSAPVDSLENALPGRKFALKKTTDTATLAYAA